MNTLNKISSDNITFDFIYKDKEVAKIELLSKSEKKVQDKFSKALKSLK